MESRHFRFVQMVSISVQPFSGKKKNLENKRGKAFKAPTRPVALHLCRLQTSAASMELGLEDFFWNEMMF